MSRYGAMFARLAARDEAAFIPFVMLGDPSLEACAEILDTLVDAGADALELGIPFSDPVADGPVIQAAALRALRAGATVARCFELVAAFRKRHAVVPVGLLVYANLVAHRSLDEFYGKASAAGVDSVLVADVPSVEAAPFAAAARAHGVDHVQVLPPNADAATLARIAGLSRGYTYVLGRAGVTGVGEEMQRPALIGPLLQLGAAPPVIGFGISMPAHVRAAIEAGAAGAISGSATVKLIETNADPAQRRAALHAFVTSMKATTRG